jgi:DNA polymerase sigma
MVSKTADMIKRSDTFHLQKALPQARYPICIAQHKETDVPLDISFTDGLGVRNNQIINYWLSLQEPNARKLLLFMRKWFDMSTFQKDNFHKT